MVNVDGFVFNVEGEKGGNLISLLNMRGKLSAEVKNWQEKVRLSFVCSRSNRHSICWTLGMGL